MARPCIDSHTGTLQEYVVYVNSTPWGGKMKKSNKFFLVSSLLILVTNHIVLANQVINIKSADYRHEELTGVDQETVTRTMKYKCDGQETCRVHLRRAAFSLGHPNMILHVDYSCLDDATKDKVSEDLFKEYSDETFLVVNCKRKSTVYRHKEIDSGIFGFLSEKIGYGIFGYKPLKID